MSLAHAILGLLTCEPMTGYDLKTHWFDDSIAHFWAADQAQIYRTLEKLNEEGLVESEIEIQETRPNRKVYRLTDAGRTTLDAWLQTVQLLPARREAFLIQLFFAARLSNDQILAFMRQQIVMHRELLERYQRIPLPALDDSTISRELLFQRMTLELGLRTEQNYIDWLEGCIARIESLETISPDTP